MKSYGAVIQVPVGFDWAVRLGAVVLVKSYGAMEWTSRSSDTGPRSKGEGKKQKRRIREMLC